MEKKSEALQAQIDIQKAALAKQEPITIKHTITNERGESPPIEIDLSKDTNLQDVFSSFNVPLAPKQLAIVAQSHHKHQQEQKGGLALSKDANQMTLETEKAKLHPALTELKTQEEHKQVFDDIKGFHAFKAYFKKHLKEGLSNIGITLTTKELIKLYEGCASQIQAKLKEQLSTNPNYKELTNEDREKNLDDAIRSVLLGAKIDHENNRIAFEQKKCDIGLQKKDELAPKAENTNKLTPST